MRLSDQLKSVVDGLTEDETWPTLSFLRQKFASYAKVFDYEDETHWWDEDENGPFALEIWDGRTTDKEEVMTKVDKSARTRMIYLRLPFGLGLRFMVERWQLDQPRTYQLAALRFDHFAKCPTCSPTSGPRRDPWRMLFVVTWGRQCVFTGRPHARVLLPWRSDEHGRLWIVADGSREIRLWG